MPVAPRHHEQPVRFMGIHVLPQFKVVVDPRTKLEAVYFADDQFDLYRLIHELVHSHEQKT